MNGHPHTITANYLLTLNNPIQKKIVISFIQCHSTKFPEDADLCFLFSFKESLPLLFSHFQAQVHVHVITSIAHTVFVCTLRVEHELYSFGTVVWPGFDSSLTAI